MRVLETRVIFQPIAQETIPPDVAQPNHTYGKSQWSVLMPTEENNQRWKKIGVPYVVEKGSQLRIS